MPATVAVSNVPITTDVCEYVRRAKRDYELRADVKAKDNPKEDSFRCINPRLETRLVLLRSDSEQLTGSDEEKTNYLEYFISVFVREESIKLPEIRNFLNRKL